MRLYTFANMYISSIQKGIQSAHLVGELFVKYYNTTDAEQSRVLYDWAENHKTMIVLDGGYSSNLRNLEKMFYSDQNLFPFSAFREDQDALNGALTCVGIVLPEKIYGASSLVRDDELIMTMINETGEICGTNHDDEEVTWKFNSFEAKLVKELTKYHLA